MKTLLLPLLFITIHLSHAQNVIEWSENYKLQLSDFQSTATKIGSGVYSLYSSARMDFSFYMSSYEFMFTKNFNSKVNCTFTRDAASIKAPDTATAISMLKFAQYDFDLSELYARKFRKNLYDKKGAFSDVNFFRPIYDQLSKDFVNEHAEAAESTELGRNENKLSELHTQVRKEIALLQDFCKSCKPGKKKK